MKKRRNQGFSLVELVIAIAMLVFIMLAVASFLSTTTRTYVNTRNDVKVQQDGQQVFDAIADKIMQAKLVRIGTSSAEYAAFGDCGSVEVDESSDYTLLDSSKNPVPASTIAGISARSLHSFSALENGTIDATNQLMYIAVLYDSTYGDSYGYAVNVFYFKENKIYMFKYSVAERGSAIETPGTPAADPTKAELDAYLTSSIQDAAGKMATAGTVDFDKQYLLCETIEYDATDGTKAYIYALPSDNAMYMTLDFMEGRMTNESTGMVTIRNSYVLQPRKYGTTD